MLKKQTEFTFSYYCCHDLPSRFFPKNFSYTPDFLIAAEQETPYSLTCSENSYTVEAEKKKPEIGVSGYHDMIGRSLSPTISDSNFPANGKNAGETDMCKPKDLSFLSSGGGFIKVDRTNALELLLADPDAFLILSVIALRALRKDSKYNSYNLKPGQAFIGDYKKFSLTRQRYRDALERIQQRYCLATFEGTNKGTIATLTSTDVFDINIQDGNHQKNQQGTRKGTNREPTENQQRTTKEEEKNVRSKEKEEDITSPPATVELADEARREVPLFDPSLSWLSSGKESLGTSQHNINNSNLSPSESNSSEKKALHPEAELIAWEFWKARFKINPKTPKRYMPGWAQDMHLLLTVNLATTDEIREIIGYLQWEHENVDRDFKWSKNICSPKALRKHFDRLWHENEDRKKFKKKDIRPKGWSDHSDQDRLDEIVKNLEIIS